jgi:hypothetical protein
MKKLETRPLTQFREAGFDDSLATPVFGSRAAAITTSERNNR